MRTFLLGAATSVILLVAGVSLYFLMGIAPVATASAPMPLEDFFAKAALRARISRERPKFAPFTADEANYLEGARVYREDCAVCHGLPGVAQSSIAKGMFPEAPQLFRGKGVTDDEPGETYWKVVNGIRMTGMPAFRQSLSERQAWEVTLMLAHADALSNPVRAALTVPAEQPNVR
jgi:mono/diheme cytochrome c family protein